MNLIKLLSLLFFSFFTAYFIHIPSGLTCVAETADKIESLVPACQAVSTQENQWDDASVYHDFTKRMGYYCTHMQKRAERIESLGKKADKKRAARRFWYNYRTFSQQFNDLEEMAQRHMNDPTAKETVIAQLDSLQSNLRGPIQTVDECMNPKKSKKE